MAKEATPTQSEKVERFLEVAKRVFCEGNQRNRESSNYIEVYAKMGKGSLPHANNPSFPGRTPVPPIVDPIEFLVGDIDKGLATYVTDVEMPDRSIAFVVGQYGLGKTELLFQIVKQSEQSGRRENFKSKILPISLAYCRERLGSLKSNVSSRDFLILLFSHLFIERGFDIQFIMAEIVPLVYSGQIILLLDGLDELIGNDDTKHREFLASLPYAFTESAYVGDLPHKLRIVVSARLEYLSVVTNAGATDVLADVNDRLREDCKVEVYFLLLDLFESSRIKTYMEYRLQEKGKNVYATVSQNAAGVLNLLRRPMLLRLFCDMAYGKSDAELSAELKDYEDTSRLMEAFIDSVREDSQLRKDEQPITEATGYTWEKDRLAYTCLDVYEEGRSYLLMKDLRRILISKEGNKIPQPTRGMPISEEIENLPPGKVLLSVHKCPFLILQKEENRGDENEEESVRFAHRIFLEYFTAKGMKLELDEYIEHNNRGKGDPFIAFDALVLNVDMRKFLKGLMDGKVWFRETKRAYGLNDEDRDEWRNKEGELNFEELDERRKVLLRSMTNPEHTDRKFMEETQRTIEWFLGMNKRHWLHPRYLVPNYEAVAVYIWNHRWEEGAKKISAMFRDVLDDQLEDADSMLQVDESMEKSLRSSYELLIERILNIGKRLRYRWARVYAEARKDNLPVRDEKTETRIKTTLESILNLEYFE